MSNKCTANNCDTPAIARGLCDKHYRRWKSHGDPNVRCNPGKRLLGKPTLRFLLDHANTTSDHCILWPFSQSNSGYGAYREVGHPITTAHRKMCILVHGEPPTPAMDAAHSCRNRHCVNPNHLSWKTKTANAQDRIADGTMIFGQANPSAKLTAADVVAIRKLGAQGQRAAIIAAKFGVGREAISKILRGKRWQWLQENSAEATAQ